MSLDRINAEIQEKKKIAEQDVYKLHPGVREFKKGQINRAKIELEDLYIKYKNEIKRRAVFILVNGKDSKLLANLAQEEFGCFSVPAEGFITDLTDNIAKEFYQDRTANASTFDVVGNLLTEKMKQLDIVDFPALLFDNKYSRELKGIEDLNQLLREAIPEKVGGEVVGYDVLEKVCRKAVNDGYDSKIVPILIYSNNDKYISDLKRDFRHLSTRVAKLTAGEGDSTDSLYTLEEVNSENAQEALVTVRNSF